MSWKNWKLRAQALRRELLALSLACRHRRTPWYAKAVGMLMIGYALSPIDLIPDPIPVLGYLDDLIVVPLGLLLFRRLVPPDVLSECRTQAERITAPKTPVHWIAGTAVILVWVAVAGILIWCLWR
jgi:uncharacterized membrane protein YkvA (DUF1232 family)